MEKQLTLLHSNDLHGDFLSEDVDGRLTGGVSMLSGYLNAYRKEDPNVLYCIAGDMFRGSVLDSEYLGVSTIQIMNLLAPDVVTLGNHETDYGVAHLLFLEKCAQFPIINANLYITLNGVRLFKAHRIIEIDGMRILFIGILTEEVMDQTRGESVIGSMIDVEAAAEEVGRICNAYNTDDIDCTVLLTHIGFEEDKKLAALLDPDWGVDIIVGGHSHTLPDAPAKVNDILIVQAGTGTDRIGRFDLVIDTDTDTIASWKWQTVSINEETCPKDPRMEELIRSIKAKTDLKYSKVIARFDYELTHPSRWMQTEMGGVFSDALNDSLGTDVFLCASGSLRIPKLGPIATLKDFTECFPYDDKCYGFTVTGAQFKHMLTYVYRDEAWLGGHTEFYQLPKTVKAVYSKSEHRLLKCELNGQEVADDQLIRMGLQEYHFTNLRKFFDVDPEEVEKNGKPRIITTSSAQVLMEYFENHDHLGFDVDDRLTVLD